MAIAIRVEYCASCNDLPRTLWMLGEILAEIQGGVLRAGVRRERHGGPGAAARAAEYRGGVAGEGDRATQGTPAKIAFTATEREDASPWPPFQTTRGLEASDSCVTVFACEGPHNIQDHGSNTALGILQTVAGAMGQAGSNNILSLGEPILALGPEHAATIAAEGYSREDVQRYVFENARYPAERVSPEFREMVRGRLGSAPPAAVPETHFAIAEAPEQIHVIVADGPGKHSA